MRPKIICHMVSSIDGRLLTDRWTPPAAGIDADLLHGHYDRVAARLDAEGWIVGRKTMEEFADGSPRAVRVPAGNLRETHIASRSGRNVAVAIDPQGRIHYGKDNAGGDHVIAVLGERVPDAYLAELREDGVSYLFAGPDGQDLHRAVDALGDSFGIRRILLEGGGRINGAFLKAGLIDEVSLLVAPAIDGLAGIPSIFEYVGGAEEQPAAGRSLRHVATETLEGGMVWLRYRVEPAPAPA
ncbi:2-hydroxy-3-oxopropionate reductase [Hypericibacter adhaerens]|uniref:2-hydroxy-3-oxopropionate reductase n=1 Tax=Hypericibacter adhaerens TaxID=2602016 RepID=A0A5J6MZK8_9PROT|nr:RibD family protein [Hypericibacter adhaerens]QEX23218.1 2-hydroxy-3-oxopropionate reductase [Hypericibacter adhaerens]